MNSRRIDHLVALILKTGRLARERMKIGHERDPMTFLRLRTLNYVREHKRPLMKDVAQHLGIAPPSATALVESLARSGNLKRHIRTGDRRQVHLTVTPRGIRTMNTGMQRMVKEVKSLLACLNRAEQTSLAAILEKLSNNISGDVGRRRTSNSSTNNR